MTRLPQLTYKQKYYLSIIGVIMAGFLSYNLSFDKTIIAIKDYYSLTDKMEKLKDAPQKIQRIEHQMKQMEHLLVDNDSVDIEQRLLEKATEFCRNNQITLMGFPKTKVLEYQNYMILTNEIVLEAPFKESLQFIYDSEQKNRIGKIASVQLVKKQDVKTKQQHLYSHIFFQNIKLKKN